MRMGKAVTALLLLFLLSGALFMSLSFTRAAKMAPILALVPGVILALWNVIAELRGGREKAGKGDALPEDIERSKLLKLFAFIIALPILSWLFGMVVGLPIFMFCFLKFFSREGWLSTLASTFLIWAVLHFGFDVLMKLNFDKGILYQLIF